MSAFLLPIDIANRALDHCGLTPITSFTQDAKAAERTASVYDKLRDAELRRNIWRFSIRKVALRAIDTDTMLLVPAAYNVADTYPQGAIVQSGTTIYFSQQYVPANTTPGSPNEAFWAVYFGPKTVTPYDSTISYYTGEMVYSVSGTTVSVYMALTTGSTADPRAAPAAWSATETYNIGDTVTDSLSAVWQSKIDLNTANSPVAGANWQSVPAGQPSVQVGQDWLKIDATVRFQRFQYPIGAGPRRQTTTRNVYRLPYGYLREASQDPKAGVASYLGMVSGLPYDDWELEGDFLTTMDSQVIILRFVADIQDVTLMDPMFCEGLGARIGLEVCEPLTQSDGKMQTIGQAYKTFMSDARQVNGIETGFVEPPVDDYVTCRI